MCFGSDAAFPLERGDGGEGGKLAGVGVNVGGQRGVAVAHQFLREPLRRSVLREPGGEGLAHGVEVEFVAQRVHLFNLRAEQVAFHSAFKVLADFENGLGLGGLQLADFFREQGVQRNDSLLFVLRGASTGEKVGAGAFKVQVGPEQLAEFADAQTGINGGQIDEPSLRSRDSKQPLQLVRRDGATFGLASAQINLGDVFERIDGESALALEPVKESVGEVEILIKRLGGQVFLLAAPGGEGVGREIIQPRETAFTHKLHHAGLHDLLIMRAAAKRLQIGQEVVQMRERGLGEGVAFLRGQGQPGLLALLVLDDGKQLGVRGLLVRRVERHILNIELAGEAEASAISALNDELAAFAAFGFIDVGNHDGRWDFRRWM